MNGVILICHQIFPNCVFCLTSTCNVVTIRIWILWLSSVYAEQTFISGLIKVETWIGLNDRDDEGTWKWINGTPPTWTYGRNLLNLVEIQSVFNVYLNYQRKGLNKTVINVVWQLVCVWPPVVNYYLSFTTVYSVLRRIQQNTNDCFIFCLPVLVRHWEKKQPDNGGGDSKIGEEDCGLIRADTAEWNDKPCETRLQWICERIVV